MFDFIPAGRMQDASLFAPEAQLASTPIVINMLNGMTNLIEYGLTGCQGGLGNPRAQDGSGINGKYCVGDYVDIKKSEGQLKWSPKASKEDANAVVDELSLLLTAGRLSAANKKVIAEAYKSASRYEKILSSKPKTVNVCGGKEMKGGLSDGTNNGKKGTLEFCKTKCDNDSKCNAFVRKESARTCRWYSGAKFKTTKFQKRNNKNDGNTCYLSREAGNAEKTWAAALKYAQKLIVASSEFNTATQDHRPTEDRNLKKSDAIVKSLGRKCMCEAWCGRRALNRYLGLCLNVQPFVVQIRPSSYSIWAEVVTAGRCCYRQESVRAGIIFTKNSRRRVPARTRLYSTSSYRPICGHNP